MSVTVSVPEAAVLLDVSERTVWRRIKDGRLRAHRDGRLVRVEVERTRRVADALAPYERDTPTGDLGAGTWPFTPEKVAAQAERLRARRMAALEEIRRLATEVKPDPEGLTFLDYLRDDDDLPPGEGAR